MIRFIHTADIHFGMENYGHIDPKTGIHTRLLDFEKALKSASIMLLHKKLISFYFPAMHIKPQTQARRNKVYCLNVFYGFIKQIFRLLLWWVIMIIP